MPDEFLFEVGTPLGWRVRTSTAYWEYLVSVKHPVLRGRVADIIRTLTEPQQVRQSRKDPSVYLLSLGAWSLAVRRTRRLGAQGFLVTAYPTDSSKAGSTVWTHSS